MRRPSCDGIPNFPTCWSERRTGEGRIGIQVHSTPLGAAHARQAAVGQAARRLHFISGLPRSGSTLLSAILRQNPRFSPA
jgi:hypothetical protein